MKMARARIYDFLREKGYDHRQAAQWSTFALAGRGDEIYVDLRKELDIEPASEIMEGILDIKAEVRREMADRAEARRDGLG